MYLLLSNGVVQDAPEDNEVPEDARVLTEDEYNARVEALNDAYVQQIDALNDARAQNITDAYSFFIQQGMPEGAARTVTGYNGPVIEKES